MNYSELEYVKKPVSRIIYGAATKPMMNGEVPWELLDEVYARGINTFDTAESYDLSEAALGEWIRDRGLRDKVVILTKGGRKSLWRSRLHAYDIESDFETSLARLGVDYIDIYLLHNDDPEMPVGPIMEILNRFHSEGRAGAIGCSNWLWSRVEEANAYARGRGLVPFSVVSPNFGLAVKIDKPEGVGATLTGNDNREGREYFAREKMPVFAYSSLGRGFFSGLVSGTEGMAGAGKLSAMTALEYAYPENFERLRRAEILAKEKNANAAQIAFAWIFTQGLDVFPITSPGSITHLNETLEAMNIRLSAKEAAWLNLEVEER